MKHKKTLISLLIAFGIGYGCAQLEIPLPAPSVLIGAFLVLSMTSGFICAEQFLAKRKR